MSKIGAGRLEIPSKPVMRPQWASLIMLLAIAISAAIVAGWFAGEGTITNIFAQINVLQASPPMWLQVPMVAGEYLLAPTVILLAIALVTMKISPLPRTWSRFLVVGILLLLTIRYIVWRSLSTLNLSNPVNGTFSLALFFLEMLMLSSGLIQMFLMLKHKERPWEADQKAVAVIEGTFTPSVDILIPTYNEPTFILQRTIIGCQALNYPNKKVYLLDDTKRKEVEALALELGCEYMTRSDNRHAKAGNLNQALARTDGDLIVVFDADFVPTENFLTRTVGFFQDEQIALVQTPQSFYNFDPIARNLGLENILTPEEEVFYRQIQPLRNSAGSVICAGTSFVVRRSALKSIGGFVTDSLSEDYFTGIRLSAQGYRLVYLDEKLSAGLAADNMADQATQRLRWAQGTLQAFFIEANPLTIRGLRPWQRLAHLEGLLHWFTSIARVGFLIAPLAYSFLGAIPIKASPKEVLYFFLPYYVVQLSVFSWLNYRSRSALLSDIYSVVLTFPLAWTVIQVMLNPFSRGFQVTPKGTASDRFSFNWKLALPLIVLFITSAVSFWRNLGMFMLKGAWQTMPLEAAQQVKGLGLGWLWSVYNLVVLAVALLVLLDIPKPDPYAWFDLRRTVRLDIKNYTENVSLWGITTKISEIGAEIALTQAGLPEIKPGEILPVTVEILEAKLTLQGIVTQTSLQEGFPTVRVMFEQVNLTQHRCLVKMLFCRPGQWRRSLTPGELQSLLLLFKVLFKPRALFGRKADISAIALVKG
ncbi:cellulose synthase (UDP-forming) [Tolypothrix sp. NIES-4075]|uniref:glycosyltransferase family 2 protein n=1 Tax=Tolypothrix sp. NIES-4075 TaxID=2005459 RepID=UPI000B6F83AB|nr:cellulose synthase catalytic subunit [Tolypothrix sp. NIES-4075]GAX43339.1 cellulose synthase (UDP-forming) [Tolypothrix sp. NIES-4075]